MKTSSFPLMHIRLFRLAASLLLASSTLSPAVAQTDIATPWTTSVEGDFSSGDWLFLNDGTNTFGSLLVDTGDGVSGGTLTFTGFSSLMAAAEASITGGELDFSGESLLEASAANAVAGGTQTFDGFSSLKTSAAFAIAGGTQTFSGDSWLDAAVEDAIAGGEQYFYGNSRLEAWATSAVSHTTITLGDSARLVAALDRTLGEGVTLRFQDGGTLEIHGAGETISSFADYSSGGTITAGPGAAPTVTFQTADWIGFDGRLLDGEGALAVAKTGTGSLWLYGDNAFSRGLDIREGTVVAQRSTALGTGVVNVGVEGTLLAASNELANVIVVRGTISPGAEVAPVSSLTTADQAWHDTGTYRWDLDNATGSAGAGWDFLDVQGSLSLYATDDHPFTIAVNSFLSGGEDPPPGDAANFDLYRNYTWTILTASEGISGLTAGNYRIDASGFTNAVTPTSTWTLTTDGSSLFLGYQSNSAPNLIVEPWRTSADGNFESGHWRVVDDGIGTFGSIDADTAGGVRGGSLEFTGLSTLRAAAGSAVDGGFQYFSDHSSLEAIAENAIAGGAQEFSGHAILKAVAAHAITGGSQTFFGDSSLEATAEDAVAGGSQEFYGHSILKASAAHAITDGSQTFFGDSSLEASAENAIAGGAQEFYGHSILKASAVHAITGGSQAFSGDSSLEASAEDVIAGGEQYFYGHSILKAGAAHAITGGSQAFSGDSSLEASAENAVAGGEQYFYGHSRLEARATSAVSNTTVTLDDSARLVATADRALGEGVTLRFRREGTLEIHGAGETISSLASNSRGGVITAGSGAAPTVTFETAGGISFDGQIRDGEGALAVAKTSMGTLVLGGDNAFSRGLDIREGTLVAAGNTSLGTGAVNVGSAGSLFAIPNLEVSNVVVVHGTISPGDLTTPIARFSTADQAWHDTGVYRWDLNDTAGYAGQNWDMLSVNGTILLTATTVHPFTVAVNSFSGTTPGDVVNFDPLQNYTWLIAFASEGLTGLTSDNYQVDTSGFTNPVAPTSAWTLATDGNGLFLTYNAIAVPEPTTWGLILGATLAFALLRRRGDRSPDKLSISELP